MRKLKKTNMRGVITVFVFIFLLGIGVFYGYTLLETGRAKAQLAEKEKILIAQKNIYTQMTKDPRYMKYSAAKTLEAESKTISWKEMIIYLIDLFDEVEALDDNGSNVQLQDFQVSMDYTINLRGTIGAMQDMYIRGGLLDKFIGLETIEFIDIPFYTKNEDLYEFVLEATIKTYDKFTGSQ